MQAWYHCENVYPFVPQEVLDRADSVRASLPNKYCDPKIAADLFQECLDEHLLCDDLGVNVVSIEHHSGINSLYGASPMILGILARQTKKVRILSLGTLITIRPDPVRASLPNKYCDPKIAADLFQECLDEHLLCDDLGVNVVSIEHHSGINSLYGASPMILGILARQTKKVRILSLGTLITIRPDPV